MGELSSLPNLGPAVEGQLISVGITSHAELKAAGAEEAWLKIQAIDFSACTNRLLALEGAIRGVAKSEIPESRKNELKEFYQKHKV